MPTDETTPCELCGLTAEQADGEPVLTLGSEDVHRSCVSNWFHINFGRETL